MDMTERLVYQPPRIHPRTSDESAFRKIGIDSPRLRRGNISLNCELKISPPDLGGVPKSIVIQLVKERDLKKNGFGGGGYKLID
jgi:hypothetical protein